MFLDLSHWIRHTIFKDALIEVGRRNMSFMNMDQMAAVVATAPDGNLVM